MKYEPPLFTIKWFGSSAEANTRFGAVCIVVIIMLLAVASVSAIIF